MSRRWPTSSTSRRPAFATRIGSRGATTISASQLTRTWTRTLAALGMAPPEKSQLDALIALDIASWTSYRDDMWTLAEEFRARGGKTGFLSNGVAEIMARIRTDRPLERWFDTVVVSCELGVVKPGAEIFQICLERLGTPPDSYALRR